MYRPPAFRTDDDAAAALAAQVGVDRIEGKRKLSQNRSEPDRKGAAGGIRASGARGAAAVAESLRPDR